MALNLQAQLDAQHLPLPPHRMQQPVHTFAINEEHHLKELMRDVKQLRRPGMHIGIAGFANFDIAAQAKSDALLLCDLNEHQVLFLRTVIALLAACETPSAFRAAFKEQRFGDDGFRLIEPVDGTAQVTLRHQDLKTQFRSTDYLKNQDWLRSPKAYAHLHQLAKEGRMATVPIDILDLQQCTALREAIGQCRLDGEVPHVATVYGSNVFDIVQEHPGIMLSLAFVELSMIVHERMTQAEKGTPSAKIEQGIMNDFADLMCRHVLQGKSDYSDMQLEQLEAEVRESTPELVRAMMKVYAQPQVKHALEACSDMILRHQNKKSMWLPVNQKRLFETRHLVYNALVLDAGLSPEFLKKMRLIESDKLGYPVTIAMPDTLSYASLRALANSPDTMVFASSIRPRPLVKFEGPESAAAGWRQKMRDGRVSQEPQR